MSPSGQGAGRPLCGALCVLFLIGVAHVMLQRLYELYGGMLYVGLGAAAALYVSILQRGRLARCAAWLWRASLPAWPMLYRLVRPVSRPVALLAGALGAGVALGYLVCCLLGALFGQPTQGASGRPCATA